MRQNLDVYDAKTNKIINESIPAAKVECSFDVEERGTSGAMYSKSGPSGLARFNPRYFFIGSSACSLRMCFSISCRLMKPGTEKESQGTP
jgi:hypothetical protein